MSYDLALYFRSLRFPDKEWTEILSWFDAIERAIEPEKFGHTPYLGKEWFIQVDDYGIFCTVYERHPPISSRIKSSLGDCDWYWEWLRLASVFRLHALLLCLELNS
jgi:hypothetical protein